MTDDREPSGLRAVARALLWVAGGMVLFMIVIGVTAPELFGSDTEVLRDTLGIIGIAAVPGLVLVFVAVWRVRRAEGDAPTNDERMAGRNGDRPHPTDDPHREA